MYFSIRFVQNLLNNFFPELNIKVEQKECYKKNNKTTLILKITCSYGWETFIFDPTKYESVKRLIFYYQNKEYLDEL